MNLEATLTVTTMGLDKLGKVCEMISCEESKNESLHLHIFPISWFYVGILPKKGFYRKCLEFLTWFIKEMINSGKNG